MRQILNSDTMGCCGDDSGLMEVEELIHRGQ